MEDDDYKPAEYAASLERITTAEAARRGPKSLAEHKAAEQEFRAAFAAHDERFGMPLKRDGVWY